MFAVGHMALAYLLSKASAKPLAIDFSIPLILVLSIIPDIDILLGVDEMHRGPTHSVVTALIIFVPIFILYRRKAVPYFIALISHSLVSDFFIGGHIMLLWPLSQAKYGNYWFYIDIKSPVNIAIEWTLFVVATLIMFKNRDLFLFFRNSKANLMLTIPILTVLLPTFAGFPQYVPTSLILPHLFYLVVFSTSVLIVIFRSLNKQNGAVKSPSSYNSK